MSVEQNHGVKHGVFSIDKGEAAAGKKIEMFSYVHDGTKEVIDALGRYIKSVGQKRVGKFRSDQYPGELPFNDEVRAYRVGFGATNKSIEPQPIGLEGFLQVDHSEAA